MIRLLILALALAGVSSAAQAQNAKVVSTCGAQSLRVNDASNLFMDATGNLCTPAGGGGGSAGSITAAGTNGTAAQAVQGINGGVPVGTATQDASVPAGSPFSGASVSTLFSIDTTGYQSITVQLTGTFSATIAWEVSNDNTNWTPANGNTVNNGAGGTTSLGFSSGVYVFPTTARYFRARISAYTSGTVTAAPVLRAGPGVLSQLGVAVTNTPGLGTSAATGGVASFSRLPSSAATANLTLAKSGAGRAYLYQGCNTTASTIYMRVYNAASTGAVTVGTTTPFAGPYAFPANTCLQATPFAADIGIYASAGLVYAFGTAPTDTDATAITAGAITAFQIGYQ